MFGHSRQQWGKGGVNQHRINTCKWKGSIEKWRIRIKMYTLKIKVFTQSEQSFSRGRFQKGPFLWRKRNIQIYFRHPSAIFWGAKIKLHLNSFFLHSKRTVERQKRRRNSRVRIYVRLKVFFSCEKGDKIPGCGLKSALGKAVALALTDQLLSHTHCYSFTDTQCKMDIGWLKLLSTDWTELRSNRYK